jgi:hypothetical protein
LLPIQFSRCVCHSFLVTRNTIPSPNQYCNPFCPFF